MSVYKNILKAIGKGERLFAVLIDPDKFAFGNAESFIKKVNVSMATHIFVGGSTVDEYTTEALVGEIKKYTDLPIIIFPGDVYQITEKADALLFLSLLSGRNPEYLIGKHVEAVSKLRHMNLEVIPTGYILIESGVKTAVSEVTNTEGISRSNIQTIIDTAKAGELLGMKLMYLEAGSGAKLPLTKEIVKAVKNELSIPLIIGGGIKTKAQVENAYGAGANIVVVGTAFEEDESFFEELKDNYENIS
ncbi:geranylgeranylglyceryl/heptaprenylglyceryl phosphate synthase [Hyunsoonleella flava]|uniref:Geranylgeranylglyceryl phosphate synthase n=1 Tax=Hyunsoonleella flava TaxID=2527939 RepID=A0A4Q9FIP9_9FLAO|nr:geranylgeranylglyceryl/heptaprenylglyceryl phosphate synthase [Hyunsoonleella flava]TBN03329.1 geranylgeranylglyceryl/heptaprenylglyceryl phosphate synthase [Hyunsoonleella flava]